MRYFIKNRKIQKEKGFSLLEIVMALAITAIATASLIQLSSDAQEQIKASAIADQMKVIYQASQAYLQANSQALATATAGGVISIPVATTVAGGLPPAGYNGALPSLQGGGYLPGAFINSNGYGQQMVVLFRMDPVNPGNIEGMVATIGGSTITDANLGRIANRIGAPGGAYMHNPPSATPFGTIAGVGGGWSTQASGWTSASGPLTYGHPMAYLSLAQSTALTDYLYRYNIGIPEANTMHTDLIMSGANPAIGGQARNNIDQAGTVDTTGVSNTAATDVYVNQPLSVSGGVGTNGLDPSNPAEMPNGWSGVTTQQVYANTLATGVGGQVNAMIDQNGNGNVVTWTVGSNLSVGGNANVNGFANVNGYANIGGTANIGGGLASYGPTSLFNDLYLEGGSGGGIIDWPNFNMYMGPYYGNNGPWLYISAAGINVPGQIYASGQIQGNGITTNQQAGVGWGCQSGTIAINNNGGGLLWCQYGSFQSVQQTFNEGSASWQLGQNTYWTNNGPYPTYINVTCPWSQPNSEVELIISNQYGQQQLQWGDGGANYGIVPVGGNVYIGAPYANSYQGCYVNLRW